MDNDSTTSVTSLEVSADTLEVFDKCLESLFVQALQTGSQSLLATHKELTDVRQAFEPHGE
jgi:hypothetical protein